jgi:hypothetical protein
VFEGFAAIGVDLFLLGREKHKFGQRKPNWATGACGASIDGKLSMLRSQESGARSQNPVNRIAEGREASGAWRGKLIEKVGERLWGME